MLERKTGFIHIYTGNGKGKTTAALGLAMRAIGWGMRACVFQFLKKGVNGEARTSDLLGGRLKIVTFDQTHPIFLNGKDRKTDSQRLKNLITKDLLTVKETLLMGDYDIVILDEINNAIHDNLAAKEAILPLLDPRFRRSEIILTGRGAPRWLIAAADYATEMRLVKHPYRKGIAARRGIEF
jgi:cob(I)alamin adenosyltransferase